MSRAFGPPSPEGPMPLPSAETELHADAPRTPPRVGAWGALVWGFACAICAAAGWAGGVLLAKHLFGIDIRATDLLGKLPEAMIGLAALGAAVALVIGIRLRLVRRRDLQHRRLSRFAGAPAFEPRDAAPVSVAARHISPTRSQFSSYGPCLSQVLAFERSNACSRWVFVNAAADAAPAVVTGAVCGRSRDVATPHRSNLRVRARTRMTRSRHHHCRIRIRHIRGGGVTVLREILPRASDGVPRGGE